MDERITEFINTLKKQLTGLPEEEIVKAAGYYEEYLADAAEAGAEMDAIFKELGTPDGIADLIRAETSMSTAQKNPGLKNFSLAMKNASRMVTTPFAVFTLSLVIAISYCLVATFFISAFGFIVATVGVLAAMVNEAFAIPSRFPADIMGTLGLGLFAGSICFILAMGFYWCGKVFIRISLWMVRLILKMSGRPLQAENGLKPAGKPQLRRAARVVFIVAAAGLLVFGVSGMPAKLFTIFNSMKPVGSLNTVSQSYDPGEVSKISLVTAHSCIKITRNNSDRITLTYEQPDWLDFDTGNSGNMLSFYEKSNGRLPLFELMTMHESRTELAISLPEGYSPGMIEIETRGGRVTLTDTIGNVNVKTYTGSIYLNLQNPSPIANIRAVTETGSITENGRPAGNKTGKGIEYFKDGKSDKTMEFTTNQGSIHID